MSRDRPFTVQVGAADNDAADDFAFVARPSYVVLELYLVGRAESPGHSANGSPHQRLARGMRRCRNTAPEVDSAHMVIAAV